MAGLGDDIYIVDNLGDKVFEVESGGLDQILASVDFSLSPHVENLTLTGMENTSGTGNNLDNRITGNNANNRLTGMGGNDLSKAASALTPMSIRPGMECDRLKIVMRKGRMAFDGRVLQGGVRRAGDAANTYTSLDGRTTYVMSGTDLLINGVLIVNENFQSGQMGIQLRDMSGMPQTRAFQQDLY
ncbi:MAG: hypothetical protein MRJ92_06350 [Nitrospira sp.]|nr:hypothetical protein [Nitrospira sp.]